MFNLKLDLHTLEQADCTGVRASDGMQEYTATAVDERDNVYIITWHTYQNWYELIEAGLEDDVCNWQVPYSIRLIERAEEED